METAVKDDNQLIDEIKKSQLEKKEQFTELVKNNPNKRLYQQRLIIQWAEVIDVNKADLRYEDNDEDRAHNQEVFKAASTDFTTEALNMAATIQNHPNFSVEEFNYSGREYAGEDRCPKKEVNIHAIGLDDAPPEVQEILKSIIQGVKKN